MPRACINIVSRHIATALLTLGLYVLGGPSAFAQPFDQGEGVRGGAASTPQQADDQTGNWFALPSFNFGFDFSLPGESPSGTDAAATVAANAEDTHPLFHTQPLQPREASALSPNAGLTSFVQTFDVVQRNRCQPFDLANPALMTIFVCNMGFDPVDTPDPGEVFNNTPELFTLCDFHVDGRRYWQNRTRIIMTDHFTGIQWRLPAGVISDGASFPAPLRGIWMDRWTGLDAESLLFDGRGRVPFALVAGFFHDYFMCRVARAEGNNPLPLDRPIQPWETAGCVHQMFEHALLAFYNDPGLARFSTETVSAVSWITGNATQFECPYIMSAANLPPLYDPDRPTRSPMDVRLVWQDTAQGAGQLTQASWSWSRRNVERGMRISATAAGQAIQTSGGWLSELGGSLRTNVGDPFRAGWRSVATWWRNL